MLGRCLEVWEVKVARFGDMEGNGMRSVFVTMSSQVPTEVFVV